MKNDDPMSLILGQPQSDHVGESGVNFYSIIYPRSNQGESLSIQITPSSGDPDIFVLVSSVSTAESRGRPNFDNYDYYSLQDSQQDDRVVLPTESSRFESLCNNEPVCLIQIGIIGYHESSYVITATTNKVVTTLAPDVPFIGIVRTDAYDYFQASNTDVNTNMKFSLRPTSGVSELLVSCQNRYPNATISGHEWISSMYSTAPTSIVLTKQLVEAQNCQWPGEIFAAVHAPSDLETGNSAAFSITLSIIQASNDDNVDSSPTLLPHGLVTSNDVEYHGISYYKLIIGGADRGHDISISATTLSGDVDLYVSRTWESRPRFTNGEMMSFEWSSTQQVSACEVSLSLERRI